MHSVTRSTFVCAGLLGLALLLPCCAAAARPSPANVNLPFHANPGSPCIPASNPDGTRRAIVLSQDDRRCDREIYAQRIAFADVQTTPDSVAIGDRRADGKPDLPTTLGRGRLFTMAGQEVRFSKLTSNPTSHEYSPGGAGRSIPFAEVARIERAQGSSVARGALFGAIYMSAAVGVYVISTLERDRGTKIDQGWRTTALASGAAGGALIGAAFATGERRYVTIYENPLIPR